MTKYGIDVYQWQGDIDWNAVKTDFAILRAGYGRIPSQMDIKFERNYKGAKAANIPVGAYWYSYAKSADEAREEAQAFIQIIQGKQFEYPVYFDVEEQSTLKLGRDKVSDIINAFLEEMEKNGYFAGLYMSHSKPIACAPFEQNSDGHRSVATCSRNTVFSINLYGCPAITRHKPSSLLFCIRGVFLNVVSHDGQGVHTYRHVCQHLREIGVT